MIRRSLLVGFLVFVLQCGYASGEGHRATVHLNDSDFHRYPPRALFTSDGRLAVAYRTADSKEASSTLQIAIFDGRTGGLLAKHSYAVPMTGPIAISDRLAISGDGHTLYYAEKNEKPFNLKINSSTLDILSESSTVTSIAADSMSGMGGLGDDTTAQLAVKIRYQNNLDDVVLLPSGGWIGRTNRSTEGSLQSFDKVGNREKTLAGKGCGFVSIQLTQDGTYGISVCERTGTTEWTFGKTLERSAVVFNVQTMTSLESISLPKKSLQTSIAKDNWHVWYPQPTIWDSGQVILIAVPDFAGTISIQELHP
jgi:hypothetical protein